MSIFEDKARFNVSKVRRRGHIIGQRARVLGQRGGNITIIYNYN